VREATLGRSYTSILISILFSILLFVPIAQAAVFINEVLPNGLLEPQSEWVELYNNDNAAVSLNGWNITEQGANSNVTLNITIPAQGFVVLVRDFATFNATFPNKNSTGLVIEYGPLVPTFQLLNGAGNITLYNASGELVDNVSYSSSSEDVSFGRYRDGTSNIISLPTLSPLAQNDNLAPSINQWIIPPQNSSNVTRTINVTVNITDDTTPISAARFNPGTGNLTMQQNGDLWYVLWDTTTFQGTKANLTVYANDSYGQWGAGMLFDITVDNRNPGVAIILPQTGNNVSGTLTVSASAIERETQTATVNVRNGTTGNWASMGIVNGNLVDGNWSLALNTLAMPDGSRTFIINATDAMGNSNTTQTTTVTIDNTAPLGSFALPQNNSNLSGAVAFTISASDATTGVRTVALQNGTGGNWVAMAFSQGSIINGNWTVVMSTLPMPDGSRTFTANITDFTGNSYVGLFNVYTIDNTAPSTSVIIPANNSVVARTINITVTATDALSGVRTVVVRNGTSGNLIAMSFLGGAILSGQWSVQLDTRGLANGMQNFTFTTTDHAGNVHNTLFVTELVDNQAPQITFNAPQLGANLSGTKIINVTAIDVLTSVSTVSFRIINGAGATLSTLPGTNMGSNFWTASVNTNAFADGTYILAAFANDTLNNINASENITVVFDNTVPTALALSELPRNNTFVNTPTNINIQLSINDTTSKVNASSIIFNINSINLAPTSTQASQNGVQATFLAVGPYFNGQVFNVRADSKDYAGNSMPSYTWSFSVDTVIPVVNSVAINDSDMKARSADTVNITINATNSASGIVNVTLVNGTAGTIITTQLILVGGNLWKYSGNVGALGCAAEGNCTLTIDARDAAGNSNTSNSFTFLIDNSNPKVAPYIVNDADLRVRSSDAIQFNITINDANFDSGSTVVIRNSATVPLSLVSTAGTTTQWSMTTNAASLGCAQGACPITAVATDIVNNVNSSEVITLIVDDTAPSINAILTNDSNNILRNTIVLNITIDTTDANGVVAATVNGTSLTQITASQWSTTGLVSNFCQGIVNANCSLRITATDVVGNVNSAQNLILGIDHTNPTLTTNTSDTNNIVASTDVINFTALVNDMFGVAQVRINNTPLTQLGQSTFWYTSNSTSQFGCAADGNCLLSYTATDNAGNSATQALSIIVDNTDPALTSFSSSPGTVFNTNNVTLSTGWGDANGMSSVTFEHNATGAKQNVTGATSNNVNFTTVLSVSINNGDVIGWKAYGIDNAGRTQNGMAIQTFVVSNRAPLTSTIPTQTWAQNTNRTMNLVSFFTDPDGDGLSFNVVLQPLNVTILINNATDSAILWPGKDFNGIQSAQLQATDGLASVNSNVFLLNVSFVNTYPPQVLPIPSFTFPEDTSNTSINLSQYVVDPDTPVGQISWTAIGNTNVIITINPITKILNVSAVPNFNGVENIVFIANDGNFQAASNVVVVNVTGNNDAPSTPTLVSPANGANVLNATALLTWNAAADPDGPFVNYVISFGTSALPPVFANTNATSLQVTGLVTGQTYFWRVSANDGSLSSANSTIFQFFVNVNNTPLPPQFTSVASGTGQVGQQYTYDADAVDSNGDVLAFSLTTAPAGMGINSANGMIIWTPTGAQQGPNPVTVQVTDGMFNVTQNFNVFVNPIPASTVLVGGKLAITDIDVKVDSKSSTNVNNNSVISREAKPGSTVKFEIEVENLFTSAEDLEIENIDVDITIEDIDDGDDLDDEADEFDLDHGDSETADIEFELPLEVDDDTYTVLITVEGEDTNGTIHEVRAKVFLEVEKEKHELRILQASLSPSAIRCEETARVFVDIINTGQEDEDEAKVVISSPDLGWDVEQDFEVEEGDEDNRYESSFQFPVPKGLEDGTYTADVTAYYDTTKVSETTTIDIEKTECVKVEQATQQEQAKAEAALQKQIEEAQKQVLQQQIAQEQQAKQQSFRDSKAYEFLLVSAFVTASIVFIILMIAVIVVL